MVTHASARFAVVRTFGLKKRSRRVNDNGNAIICRVAAGRYGSLSLAWRFRLLPMKCAWRLTTSKWRTSEHEETSLVSKNGHLETLLAVVFIGGAGDVGSASFVLPLPEAEVQYYPARSSGFYRRNE